MDHTEAREQLLERSLEPARLRGLEADTSPGSAELRAHLAACADCRGELDAWRTTIAALDLAVGADPVPGGVPASSLGELAASAGVVVPPGELRARALAAALEPSLSPAPRAEAPRRSVGWPAWLAMAAIMVVFLGGVAMISERTQQLDRAQADATALAGVTATLDRILRDPGHQVAVLMTPAGVPGGSVSWSASDGSVVVLSTALSSPPPGQVYRCWIAKDGTSTAVGEMQFSGPTAYWAGSVGSWGDSFSPGGHFWVSLEPIAGGARGTPALVGTL